MLPGVVYIYGIGIRKKCRELYEKPRRLRHAVARGSEPIDHNEFILRLREPVRLQEQTKQKKPAHCAQDDNVGRVKAKRGPSSS
jgi:anti-sigma factor RsiW